MALRPTLSYFAPLMAAVAASAQCPPAWEPSGLNLPGTDGPVWCSAVWDPDGNGPLSSSLVIAGPFTIVEGLQTFGVAAWNGATWESLGNPGFPVGAMLPHAGQLIAGGRDAAGPVAAAWNGQVWTVIGRGEGQTGSISALAEYQGQVYACGQFTTFGGAQGRLVRRTGQGWEAVPGAFAGATYPQAMAVHDNRLVIAGGNEVDRWDGNALEVDPGVPGYIRSLGVHAGELYAGCSIFIWGNLVLRWNGQAWLQHGSNIGTSFQSAFVSSLQSYEGDLYAGGSFVFNPPLSDCCVARWREDQWQPVGSGGCGAGLVVFDGRLYGASCGLLSWSDSQWREFPWRPPSISGVFSSIALVANETWVCGGFELTRANGEVVRGVARRSAGDWLPAPALPATFSPMALLATDHGVYVGGGDAAPDAPAVFRLAGGDWEALPGIVVAPQQPIDLLDYGGSVVAAGTLGLGLQSVSIARWNGASWVAMAPPPGTLGPVHVHNEELFAASSAPGFWTSTVWRFNGATWSPLGTSFNAHVNVLGSFNGEIVAGAYSYNSGPNPANPYILSVAAWNGQLWRDFAVPPTGLPTCFAQLGSALFVGGFTGTAGRTVPFVYSWSGSHWNDYGIGLPSQGHRVYDLAAAGGVVHAVGSFNTVAGVISPAYANLREDSRECYPDCDCSSGSLNVADFTCFLQQFAAGNNYANCDQSTAPPNLNVADFTCFLQRFAAGCP